MTAITSLFIITIALSIIQNYPVRNLYVDSEGRLYRE